jgi:hypothetical protein
MNTTGSGDGYLIGAYVIGLLLLWGYAALSWIDHGRLHRRHRRRS